jgi:3-methyladenine DNA glycosylase AlkD
VNSDSVFAEIYELRDSAQASTLSRFFKTGPGEYGEGDFFLGLKVPQTRQIAKKYSTLPLKEIHKLLKSDFHEVRLCGLLILVAQFEKAKDRQDQKPLFDFYIKAMNQGFINNWDLVDVTAPRMGRYLVTESDSMDFLTTLAISDDLWHRRLSIVFTFAHQKYGDLMPTIEISELLLEDEEDLIHKAVGWALREVGKNDLALLRQFLKLNGNRMPRTALRYAIEKMSESERRQWLLSTK